MPVRRPLLFALLAALSLGAIGCPKPVLPPPPKVGPAPAAMQLAKRDAVLSAVRASATIRMHIPEGMDGAPGGKVHAIVVSAARPDRARLEILTPLGTPGATILLADGKLQVYQPLENELLVAPLDSKDLAARAPFPIPMSSLPALLRGSVPLQAGDLAETRLAADGSNGAASVLEVRSGSQLAERVTVSPDGGYPTEDVRFENGKAALTIDYADYGGVETKQGSIAFPQKITATIERPEGTATLDISLSDIEVAPDLADDEFTLVFGQGAKPRVTEIR